jgi:glucose-1-phosphate adenylyltransferase
MAMIKNTIAMLLAGGQGSRLYALTSKLAKPAVSYGGKYRIIDFPLSNCVNSDIDTVGVLTQYQPFILSEYVGNGQPWDMDRNFGGVHVLPPYQAKSGSEWYKGTANAIYQNIGFIKKYNPKNVLILSGDHIYKMDYSLLIEYHENVGADCTIAAITVPLEEASRFGILNTDKTGRITEFEEKPKNPKSDKASMGIYVFRADKLTEYLLADEKDAQSAKDFGKNVIPQMLRSGEKMYSYPFRGYWRDVGTIESLWQANMDLLGDFPAFDIYDENWKIHSRSKNVPPFFAVEGSKIINSLISGGCKICGTVINSVLGSNVTVGRGAVVKDSVVMSGASVGSGAEVCYSIVDEDAVIGERAQVGGSRQGGKGIAVVGRGYTVGDGLVVGAGELLESIA